MKTIPLIDLSYMETELQAQTNLLNQVMTELKAASAKLKKTQEEIKNYIRPINSPIVKFSEKKP